MKKLTFILSFLFIFASSASATVYKWVDENGTVNFADDYDKVPPDYGDKVEQVNVPGVRPLISSQAPSGRTVVSVRSVESAVKPPAIGQTLIREGDFAVSLTEVLKLGRVKGESEAEDRLSSAGIAPKNGWIADYPVTPDILGELQNAIGSAADSGKLGMERDEAIRRFQELTARQDLPIRADTGTQYAGTEQPPAGVAPLRNYADYYEASVINNYYYDQGPPIVTYYPPPTDYYYLYSWVPYPFWYSGFWFPGFFCLHDFHRGHFVHGNGRFISNHFFDSKTREFGRIDPARRHMGNAVANTSHSARGFNSHEARNGASSILGRSSEHATRGRPTGMVSRNRGTSGPSGFRGRVGAARPSTGYRPPSSGYSRRAGVAPGGSTYRSHRAAFARSGMGTGRSFSPTSKSRNFALHGGGSGSRGFSGGGSRGFSAGGGRGFSGGGRGHR